VIRHDAAANDMKFLLSDVLDCCISPFVVLDDSRIESTKEIFIKNEHILQGVDKHKRFRQKIVELDIQAKHEQI
jgi:hypothetical protein